MLKSECKVIMSPHQNTLELTLLVFVLACLNTDVGFALQLQGSQTSQSSTRGDNLAGLAVDNNIQTTSITNEEANPWWKVDLGNTYCLEKITLFTRPSDGQLEGAVVRAGLSPNHLQNRMIGSPLTLAQAQSGQSTVFTLDPTVIARYVSVDIPTSSGEMKSLVLGEVEVDEIIQSDDYTTSSALPLLGNPSRQRSQYEELDASRALDGNLLWPFCTHTAVGESNPWWKVDLVTEYCVGKIRIWNRDPLQVRLVGAVVRAGLSDVFIANTACGSPVTSTQASSGDWIEFTCDPPRQTRYVSVDLPGDQILTLCEVQVLTCKEIDFTLVINIPVIGETGDNEAAITAYKGCSDLTASVSFDRQLTTRGTNTGLPTGFNEVDDPILGRAARSLMLPEAGGINRVGVFYSEVTKSGRSSRIHTILLPKDDSVVNIRPVQRTLTVNAGESVNLTMVPHNSQTNVNIRWKHNEDAMDGWNNQLTVSIPSVVQSDEGIYSCFVDGQEHQQRHGIMRLIVRACPSGMWGPVCSNTCRRCYNGGICDDQTGTCVCAPGFSGPNCEKVHGRHVFGKDAQYSCSDSHDPHHAACQGHLFCLPDPYGCSCAAGNMGLGCMQECPEGMYGADCKQACHCQGDGTCLKDTGKCMEGVGCQSPYFGHNCQCTGMITDTVILQLARSDGPSEIALQWDAVTCADEYRVEYLQLNKEGCQAIDPSSASNNTHCSCQSTSSTIPDLDSNSLYQVKVQARFGSSYSPAATREVMTGTSEPKASPTEVLNSTKTNTSLSFSWSEPPCGGRGGIITGYTYKLIQVGSMPDIVADQTSTSSTMVTIHSLIPYTNYSFQVAASTSEGTGPFSNGIIERTLEGVPPAPMNLKVRSADESSITVEWTEPDPPRGIIINYDISYWSSMQSEASAIIKTDIGMTSLSYQIEGLVANVTYFIKVRATTSAGTGVWSVAVNGTAKIGVPGPVENLRSTDQTDMSITLEWGPPLNPNGQIMKYLVEYRAVEKRHQVDFTADRENMRMELGNESRTTLSNLEPTTKYEFSISAINQMFPGEKAVIEVFTKPLENPPSPPTPNTNPDDATDTTVTINLSRVPDDDYITSYVIHVKKIASKTKREALDPIQYVDSHDNYIAAELSKQMVPDSFVVGDGGIYGGYDNAPLVTGAPYAIRVGSVSRGNGTDAKVTYSDSINIKAMAQPPALPVGLIVGVLVAVIIIVVIIIVVIMFLRRKRNDGRSRKSDGGNERIQLAGTQRQANNFVSDASLVSHGPAVIKMPTPSSTPSPSRKPTIPTPSSTPSSSRKPTVHTPSSTPSPSRKPTVQSPQIEKLPFTNPPPIRIDELEKYIQMKKSAAADKSFDADYKALPDGQLHPWTVARKPQNKTKNRYANVIAYDYCRVVLEPLENDPHSDYINACYIDGYQKKDKYIASQGPNKESIKDIWRMIWQQNVDKIVMLTNPIEDGKMKCLQYWADKGSSEYTGIYVTTAKEDVFLDYTVRIFNINEVGKDDAFRIVKHFHYTTWPDMKPPEYPTPLLNFLRVVNAHKNTGRTVIHCSAGVGRTGTYITLDAMLEQMEQEGQVGVLGFIYQMRDRRIKSVQTAEQYKFLYDAILEAYLTGDTTYHVTEYRRKLAALKKMGMEQQFEMLERLSSKLPIKKSESGKLPENVTKNRYPDFVPTDRSRPFLMTITSEEDTNYINGTYLPGYRKKNRYVATQMPTPITKGDIWRLVYDHKSTCIVMLNQFDQNDETMVQYWPEAGPMEFGPLVVELLETKEYTGVIGNSFTLRNKNSKLDTSRTVCQFQYVDWPSDQEVPRSFEGLLTLIQLTEQWKKTGEGPIVVHCIDGLGRSAAFCALMTLIEKFKQEMVVDVFQEALQLRTVNTNMMYSLEHYAMCYDVIQEYMSSSSENTIYENLNG